MDGLFGDGLVDVLCCGGDSLEEDLRWGPRLGALVDLVEFEDGVTNGGVALFKIVEALSGGAFFFSTSVELKTKGAGGGGAGREMMDSNTSLPAILTPKHFLAVSAICFDRSDFACIWVLKEASQTWTMFSELKALVDSEKFRVIVFGYGRAQKR